MKRFKFNSDVWWCRMLIVLLLHSCKIANCLSPLWESVTTNVYQEYDVQEGKQTWVVRMNMGEYKSTDLVVGEDIRPESRVILTCTAHHGPAEWVYSGDGKPSFMTNTTIENLSSNGGVLPLNDMNGAKRYVATLALNRMTTKDTGRYNCLTASPDSGNQYKTLSAFYHLYVPDGNKLFIRNGGETIHYDLHKSAARIPCGVTNPKTSVTLQKVIKGNLEFRPYGANMLYHAISGFYPKKDIPGHYICTAYFNKTIDVVDFTLVPKQDVSYHNNIKYNNRKTSKRPAPTRFTKPEDLEWLMYATPGKTTKTTKQPPHTNPPPKPSNKPSNSYVPFHIRYSTTTYGPFQTFFDVKNPPTTKNPYGKFKPTTTKPRPYNPFEYYPSEVSENITRRPPPSSSSQGTRPATSNKIQSGIPTDIISYRPVFNFFKDTARPTSTTASNKTSNSNSRPTISSQRPQNTVVSSHPTLFKQQGSSSSILKLSQRPAVYITEPDLQEDSDESDTEEDDSSGSAGSGDRTTSMRPPRTTPRKYRPFIIPTTEVPVLIPESVICEQFSCGTNAVCFANYVRYDNSRDSKAEPACKCNPGHIGNPYLDCYLPVVPIDPNVLFFNASFRTPVLAEPIYSDSVDASNEEYYNKQRHSINEEKTTSISIIDM